jgi:phosphatidylglycerophosphate synthase
MSQNKSKLENTFKSKETEEFLDVIFYRPLGYLTAVVSKKMGTTPNGITIFSIFVGILAGHLFYYNNLLVNITGIVLLIFAEILDSADGQLARMTNKQSREGRILDGFSENLWFVSIYLHLALRMINDGWSPAIFLFILICGVSHSLQGAVADYGRNFYLYFVYGNKKSEVDQSKDLADEYNSLSWKNNFIKKFLLRIYLNYTREQEVFAARSIKLLNSTAYLYPEQLPDFVKDEYRGKNKKLIKYYNILTTNTRMGVLILSLLINYVPLYFIFEATVLNVLLIYTVYRQEKNAEEIYLKIMKSNQE